MCRQNQRVRVFRQFNTVEHQLQQIAVIAGVSDQHRAKQGFIVFADDQSFIDFFAFIKIDVAAGARRAAMRIADAAHVNAKQLQFGAEIGPDKAVVVAEEMVTWAIL